MSFLFLWPSPCKPAWRIPTVSADGCYTRSGRGGGDSKTWFSSLKKKKKIWPVIQCPFVRDTRQVGEGGVNQRGHKRFKCRRVLQKGLVLHSPLASQFANTSYRFWMPFLFWRGLRKNVPVFPVWKDARQLCEGAADVCRMEALRWSCWVSWSLDAGGWS